MMTAEDVVSVMLALGQAHVNAWLDGGWGVDALLKRQTRPHDDLDLVLALDALPTFEETMLPLGYEMWKDDLPIAAVYRAESDKRIDLHPVTFDAEGGGFQQQPSGVPFRYPPEGFGGSGMVAGHILPCLSPEVQVLCHAGYELDAGDIQDVRLLCAEFGLPLPPSCEAT